MKKIITNFLVAIIISSAASAQIPNFSFENWTSMGSYENPDMWGTMNNMTSMASVYTATKGTPGNPGSSYLKLTSKTVMTAVVPGIAVSGKLDSTTMQPKSGFAYNQMPQGFSGKWQHMIYGNSQGSISVTLTRWNSSTNQREVVATANQTLSGMAMSWANFTIPFTYLQNNLPDSCIIVMRSSGANPTNNDYLWVDNLTFSGSVAGIENHSSVLENLIVYPNPSSGNLAIEMHLSSEEQIKIEMTDVNGKSLIVQDCGLLKGKVKQILDVSIISGGVYFVKVFSGNGIEVRKIVIE